MSERLPTYAQVSFGGVQATPIAETRALSEVLQL